MTEPVKTTVAAPRDRWYCALAVAILGVMYLSLHVGHWAPGTDMQYYLDIARSIVQGEGYAFNSSPAGLAPPGWPYVLAGLMKISSSYGVLNLFPTAMVLIAVGAWYWIVRRWTTPGRTLVVVLLSATFWWWYSSAVLLTSEALFMALFAPALLLALQISEGRRSLWRIAALVLLCAGTVCVRFTGIVSLAVILGALCSGLTRRSWDWRWLSAIVLAGGVTAGVFVYNHLILLPKILPKTVARPVKVAAVERKLAGSGDDAPGVMPGANLSNLMHRGLSLGRWFAGLFWMPAEMGVSSGAIGLAVNLVGLVLVVFFCVTAALAVRQRQWVWLGALALCCALALRWKSPNSRYIMPIAPLLLAGVWLGIEHAARWAQDAWARRCTQWLGIALLASLALCNSALWAVDLWVSKQSNYYEAYYAGQGKELVAAAAWLNEHALQDGELAISAIYDNLGRKRQNGLALRGMRALTDRRIRIVPQNVCAVRPEDARVKKTRDGEIDTLTRWAMANDVRYYLYRPPLSPWRVWHFRMPAWLQKMITHESDIPENPFFELYELQRPEGWFTSGQWVKVELPANPPVPRRVEGLP